MSEFSNTIQLLKRKLPTEVPGRVGQVDVFRLLLKRLSSDDKNLREAAARHLGKLGKAEAIESLIQASGRGRGERARRAAIQALARIGKPAIRPLINTMLHDNSSVLRRASAAEALGLIGSRRAVKPLIHAMNDSRMDVRLHTVVSLSRLNDTRAIPPIVRALFDESGGVRVNAAAALGVFRSRKAVRPLIKALADDKWYVRQQAARSLGQIGDKRAVDGLRRASREHRRAVVAAAREALAKLDRDRRLILG